VETDVASRVHSSRRSPRARSRTSRSTASGNPARETHATLPLALGCPRPLPRRQPHNDRDSNRTATATARPPGQPGIATATTQQPHSTTDSAARPPPTVSPRTTPRSGQHRTALATAPLPATASLPLPQQLCNRFVTATATAAATATAPQKTRSARVPHARLLDRQLPHSFCGRSLHDKVLVGATQRLLWGLGGREIWREWKEREGEEKRDRSRGQQ
jgi:hypothetical protein